MKTTNKLRNNIPTKQYTAIIHNNVMIVVLDIAILTVTTS